jgi:hypothetical protein
MTENNHKHVLNKAIEAFGVSVQYDMLTEEIGELLQAFNKLKRKTKLIGFNTIQKPGPETPICEAMLYHNLCSEINDVQIVLDQFKSILCQETLSIERDRKISRLEERLIKYIFENDADNRKTKA